LELAAALGHFSCCIHGGLYGSTQHRACRLDIERFDRWSKAHVALLLGAWSQDGETRPVGCGAVELDEVEVIPNLRRGHRDGYLASHMDSSQIS